MKNRSRTFWDLELQLHPKGYFSFIHPGIPPALEFLAILKYPGVKADALRKSS